MNLKKKTINGLMWSGVSQSGKQLIQFVITIILARLLSPNDFGMLSMAAVFTGFAAIFGEMGLSSAIIQKQDINEKHLSSAFWLNVIFGIILTIFFLLISPLISTFYGKPELRPILMVLSFNFILSSFTIIQQTVLSRDMDFRALAVRDIIAVIVSGFCGVFFAYKGYGVWSLVYQSLSFTLADGLLLWSVSNWRPKFIFSITAVKDIFQFSMNLTGFNIVNYFSRNVDQLLIGKFLGAQALGFYSLAYKIMLYPVQNISAVVNKVIFPAFSRIQHDLVNVHYAYLKMVKMISLITFPIMSGLFVITADFVPAIFGDKWFPAVILIKIFCVCGMIQSISSLSGNIFLSQDRSDVQFKFGFMGAILVFVAIILGLRWGITGVSLFYTFEQLLWGFFVMRLTGSLIKLQPENVYAHLKNSVVIALGIIPITFLIKSVLHFNSSINLIINISAGIVFYVISLFVLKEIYFKQNKIIIDGLSGE